MSNRRYLGDAVYVEHDGHYVILTTEDGRGPVHASNRIYLEPDVIAELMDWLEALWRKTEAGQESTPR